MTQSWAVDGQFADDNYKDLIFTNAAIDKFLDGHDRFIVVASKGMGKTLLMRMKRDRVHAENPSIILIPHGNPSDYVNLAGTYEKGILELMRDQHFWEDLWKLAIQTSVLLNFPHHLTEEEKVTVHQELARAGLPGDLQEQLKDALDGKFRVQRSPSSVLSLLLSCSRSKLERLRLSAPQVLYDLLLRHVNSACFVFIDSFDQAIEHFLPDDLEAWSGGQRGLLRAAWDISRHNRHVKVYVTIRQEAYASYDGPDRNNIRGSILLLEYSKEDLRSLLLKAIGHYEGLSTVEDFVGLPKIYNEYVKRNEEVFDYIHRHLIEVPRWFTILGGRLSELRKKEPLTNKRDYEARLIRVREIVNRVSADLAKDYLCSEMRLFFRGLDPNELVRELFSRVNTTVLSYNNVDELAKLMSTQYGWSNPFSLLYNLGLLGLVRKAAGSHLRHQIFKKPYEFDWSFKNIVPEDKNGIYLLHAALHYFMTTINPCCKYSAVLVGDGLPWGLKNDDVVRRETVKIFISYAHADEGVVQEVVQIIRRRLAHEIRPHKIWFDKWSLEAGRGILDQLAEGLKGSDFLILMVSPKSMKSKFVEMEWKQKLFEPFYKRAKNHDRVLPVFIEKMLPNEVPEFLSTLYGYSYRSSSDESAIDKLVDQILNMHR